MRLAVVCIAAVLPRVGVANLLTTGMTALTCHHSFACRRHVTVFTRKSCARCLPSSAWHGACAVSNDVSTRRAIKSWRTRWQSTGSLMSRVMPARDIAPSHKLGMLGNGGPGRPATRNGTSVFRNCFGTVMLTFESLLTVMTLLSSR